MKVPDALQLRVGTVEIWRSLKTYSPIKARHLAAKYAVRLMEAFAMMTNKGFAKEECVGLLSTVFRGLAASVDDGIKLDAFNPDEHRLEQEVLSLERSNALSHSLATGVTDREAVALAEQALWQRGVALDTVEEDRMADLVDGFTRALIERERLFRFRLRERLIPYQPEDQLFRSFSSREVAPSELCGSSHAINLGEAVKEYLCFGERHWVPKTLTMRRRRLDRLVQFFGADRLLCSLFPNDMRAYRDSLPAIRLKDPKGPRQFIAAKTAQLIYDDTRAFFRWAKRSQGYIDRNPTEDVVMGLPKQAKSAHARRPFSEKELYTLFSSPLYRGCRSRRLRFKPGPEIYRDSGYWIPLLGYYTGARLGELVQLEISDVVLDDPIPHIFITDLASASFPKGLVKRVKSPAAVRKIPIHPHLMELGFASFVELRRNLKRSRLFFDIDFGADGQASTIFSKRFGRMLDKVGLVEPGLVFHSYRHGMEDALRNARQPQYVIDRIIGHSDGSVSAGYGEGVSLEVAYQAICEAKLPVDVPSILR